MVHAIKLRMVRSNNKSSKEREDTHCRFQVRLNIVKKRKRKEKKIFSFVHKLQRPVVSSSFFFLLFLPYVFLRKLASCYLTARNYCILSKDSRRTSRKEITQEGELDLDRKFQESFFLSHELSA